MNIYIETYGCSANQSESEMMAGMLARSGFHITGSMDAADILIINTCVVKKPTEDKILERLRQLSAKYPEKKILVAGCMPEVLPEKIREAAPQASMLGTHYIADVSNVIKKLSDGISVEKVGKTQKEKLCLPRIRKNDSIAIVPISSGCLSNCSYCIVKRVKGSLFSYSNEKIIREILSAKKAGCKEFWLTAQDCGCYGLNAEADKKGNGLPELLKSIVSIVPGKYWLRVGMLNPRHLKKICPELIEAYKDEHIFKFLHLPVQSGSNATLEKMKRGYTVKDFKKIVSAFERELPSLQLWTDVIVGFPGETDEDFFATYELIKDIKPDFVNVSKFGARPGTAAEKMTPVSADVIKNRSKVLSELVDSIAIEKNRQWKGWSGPVLIDEYNPEKKSWIGRNFAYKPVVLQEKCMLGQLACVKIISTGRVLKAELAPIYNNF
ncbi:MAG: tRNA (N(6)-L-threonylcarbamoyladenosine(37)-C(2))-methylthiotransferase [Candidatus Aenigmarchaeota archaeon]|nr:tRNA (N(6)-L-threonylcarbamoyladenosine(37)-C(2))-methylthiotransferase [Candidatus Aenigmarchaeota archaeon]